MSVLAAARATKGKGKGKFVPRGGGGDGLRAVSEVQHAGKWLQYMYPKASADGEASTSRQKKPL